MSFLSRFFTSHSKVKTELFKTPPPPTDAEIRNAEISLKLKFPDTFIAFMRNSRELNLPLCAQFYWVGDDSLGTVNIVSANFAERNASGSRAPDFFVAFYNDGMGNQVCFDTRRPNSNGEYPIVFWDHELDADENLAKSDRPAINRENVGCIANSFPDWWKTEHAALTSSTAATKSVTSSL